MTLIVVAGFRKAVENESKFMMMLSGLKALGPS